MVLIAEKNSARKVSNNGFSLTIGHEKLEVNFSEPKITPGVSRIQSKERGKHEKRVQNGKK